MVNGSNKSSFLTQAMAQCEIPGSTPVWGVPVLTSCHLIPWSTWHLATQLEERYTHMYTNFFGSGYKGSHFATLSCKRFYQMWIWSSRVSLANKPAYANRTQSWTAWMKRG